LFFVLKQISNKQNISPPEYSNPSEADLNNLGNKRATGGFDYYLPN
jgi:hypothetical protein